MMPYVNVINLRRNGSSNGPKAFLGYLVIKSLFPIVPFAKDDLFQLFTKRSILRKSTNFDSDETEPSSDDDVVFVPLLLSTKKTPNRKTKSNQLTAKVYSNRA